MELNTSTKGSFCEVVRENLPWSFDKVPLLVPLMVTDTDGTASLLALLLTAPEIVIDWAKAAVVNRLANRKAAKKRKLLLIIVIFIREYQAKYRLFPSYKNLIFG
jgi:hypothetical protein